MSAPMFRLVCPPSALATAPQGWATEMLRDGEMALLAGEQLAAINDVARALDVLSVTVLRDEEGAAAQEQTVVSYAASLPLLWVGSQFSDQAREWATRRGPMTLLVEVDGELPEAERRRVERFVAVLGRQAE